MLHRRARAAALATAALLLTSCSGASEGNRDEERDRRGGADVPALEAAWTAPAQTPFSADDTQGDGGQGDGVWVTPDHLVVIGDAEVVALDPDSGERRWRLELAGQTCASSFDVNDAGVGIVVTGARCRTVVAVDSTTGSRLWSTRVPAGDRDRTRAPRRVRAPAVGARVTALTGRCRRPDRIDLDNGKLLPPLPGTARDPEDLCGPSSAASGRSLVVTTAVGEDRSAYRVHDLDTGRLRRVITTPTWDTHVDRVIHDDPLLVISREHGHASIRDLSGRRSRPIGRELEGLPHVIDRDGRLLIRYGSSDLVEEYDPAARATRPVVVLSGPSGEVSAINGTQGAGVVGTWRPRYGGDHLTVQRFDADRPEGAVVLGTISTPAAASTPTVLVGDRLVLLGTETRAYDLPVTGTPRTYGARADELARDELSAREAVDLCPAISLATRRSFGFPTDLGAPASCRFHVEVLNDWTDLGYSTSVHRPGNGMSATEVAEREFQRLVEHGASTTPLTPYDGPGDESAMTPDGIELAVRVANVVLVLTVQVTNEDTVRAPLGKRLRAATQRAADELVAELELRRATA